MLNSLGPDLFDLDAHKREKRLVETTLHVLGLENHAVAIRRNHADCTGEPPRLSFLGFRAEFDDFPIYLAYENLYKLNKHTTCKPSRVLTRPSQTIAAQRFADVLADGKHEVGDRPVGMIFPYDGMRDGLILHDADLGSLRDPSNCRLEWTEGDQPRCLERYYVVLRWLKHCDWEPCGLVRKDPPERISPICLMREIQGHAALRVLLLFVQLASPASNPFAEQKSVGASVVRRDGQKWWFIKQPQIATSTGLCLDRVKHAVSWLRQQGYLVVKREGRTNLYRLPEDLVETFSLEENVNDKAS